MQNAECRTQNEESGLRRFLHSAFCILRSAFTVLCSKTSLRRSSVVTEPGSTPRMRTGKLYGECRTQSAERRMKNQVCDDFFTLRSAFCVLHSPFSVPKPHFVDRRW